MIARIASTPRALRRVRLDNLALVPGSMLLYRAEWQRAANRLPKRAILIVLPVDGGVQKSTMLRVAKLLSQSGHQVRVVPADEIVSPERLRNPG